jgi:hypothetical protein
MVAGKIQNALQAENISVFLREQSTGDFLNALTLNHHGSDKELATAGDELRLL